MKSDVLILGQGLAGTLLAWELERAGITFQMVDPGHAQAATMAAAGIINPITGRRLVKSWQVETLLPAARERYREIETGLGVRLWHEMRVRRFFADEREQAAWREKRARGELAPYATVGDDDGFWIEGAARVDLATLLTAARARWEAGGVLSPTRPAGNPRPDLVIDCTGRVAAKATPFAFVPWEFSKGELLELAVKDLEPEVILNRRQWVVPTQPGAALVGATQAPGRDDATLTPEARTMLEASARDLLPANHAFTVTGQRAGVRVTLRDKRPVAGRHPTDSRLGLINGLGAKGALWAPMLARQWVNHLIADAPFDPEIAVGRFVPEAK